MAAGGEADEGLEPEGQFDLVLSRRVLVQQMAEVGGVGRAVGEGQQHGPERCKRSGRAEAIRDGKGFGG